MKMALSTSPHLTFAVVAALAVGVTAGDESASKAQGEISKGKQTTLGLYVTAKEAYAMWKAEPTKVKILDVRTPEEYLFVGHPEMAWNIPLAFQTHQWVAGKKELAMKPNLEFVSQVKEWAQPGDRILVMCRSGGRGAMAVNALAKEGFTHAYNVVDGIEGDAVADPESAFFGKRMKNGWKNAGLPWTYDLEPEQMRLPKP